MFLHCERISPIMIINTSIISCIYIFSFIRTFKFCPLSKFQVHSSVTTMVTMLHPRSSNLIHLITIRLHLLPTSPSFPYSKFLAITFQLSISMDLTLFFFFFFKIRHISDTMAYLSFSVWFILLSMMLFRFIHVVVNDSIFLLFLRLNNILLYMYVCVCVCVCVPHFPHPFIH